ncbi:hypothetical protein GCM10023213_28420 [Prosthecobacter algae]|uniref:Uncharacterized protein n=1 Tax=Prosthecobacter algae TaxID=1144682 RepID=A0ABP9PA77_9BACT
MTKKSVEKECVKLPQLPPPKKGGEQTGQRQDVTVKRQHAHDTLTRVKQPAPPPRRHREAFTQTAKVKGEKSASAEVP